MLSFTISWVAALILVSPVLAVVAFKVWEEWSRSRNQRWKHEREIRELESLLVEARNTLVTADIALENPEFDDLVEATEAYQKEHEALPSKPEDLPEDVQCTYKTLFWVKARFKVRAMKKKLNPFWVEQHHRHP